MNHFFELIYQSDMMTKFVLLLLLGMSLWCWNIFFYKLYRLSAQRAALLRAYKQLKHITNRNDIHNIAMAYDGTVVRGLLLQLLTESADKWRPIEETAFALVDTIMIRLEAYSSVLSTSAAVAPLLGLFGTVWGLVHSFMNISKSQHADISVVAPGIAEALITTLVGLMVAIPALILFNIIQNKLQELEQVLVRVAQVAIRALHTLDHAVVNNQKGEIHDTSVSFSPKSYQ